MDEFRDDFRYRGGRLHAESVPLERIADQLGTPFYCYSTATLERRYRAFADAFSGLPATICYAIKANGNIAVIRTLAELGAGADVVSAGELTRALAAGVPASRIVFSGVGKTTDEMAAAIDAGVSQINVESEPELAALDTVARARSVSVPVAIRVNPGVDALTHDKITTGKPENKFGIDWTRAAAAYAAAAAMPGLSAVGLAVHIGSQLTDLAPYREAYGRLREIAVRLRADGHRVERLDLGGGLGISYGGPDESAAAPPTPAAYAAVVRAAVGDLGCRLVLEPGRAIVGEAGVLVTRVLYVKDGGTRTIVIVDAAMNDLVRPALYGAYHAIQPVVEGPTERKVQEVDVVGPVCETGDTFAVRRTLPVVEAGETLALRAAGAYGAVMASTYNARPLVPEVLVKEGSYAVVADRVPVEGALARESLPDWLAARAAAREAGR